LIFKKERGAVVQEERRIGGKGEGQEKNGVRADADAGANAAKAFPKGERRQKQDPIISRKAPSRVAGWKCLPPNYFESAKVGRQGD